MNGPEDEETLTDRAYIEVSDFYILSQCMVKRRRGLYCGSRWVSVPRHRTSEETYEETYEETRTDLGKLLGRRRETFTQTWADI